MLSTTTPIIKKLFVGTWSKNLYILDLNMQTGEIILKNTINIVNSPSWITFNSTKTHLYATSESENYDLNEPKTGGIFSFKIDIENNNLEFINSVKSYGGAPCHLQIGPLDKEIAVTNYSGGNLCIFSIDSESGALAENFNAEHKNLGKGVNLKRQEMSHPHQIIFDRSKNFVFLTDLGLDKVYINCYNKVNASIFPHLENSFLKIESGSGPRHMDFHPNEKFAYIINELTSTITVCEYNKDKGILNIIQTINLLREAELSENFNAGEILVSEDGKFVYASNRDLKGNSDSLVIFQVDNDSGMLKLIRHQPTGRIPRHFTIIDNLMLVVNQEDNRIQVFYIYTESGLLNEINIFDGLDKPVMIAVL